MGAEQRIRRARITCRATGQATVHVSSWSRTPTSLERKQYEDLIRRLTVRRIELGMTQEQLGDRLGVASGLVAKWEMIDRLPSLFMMACWASALNVTLVPV